MGNNENISQTKFVAVAIPFVACIQKTIVDFVTNTRAILFMTIRAQVWISSFMKNGIEAL